MPDRLGVTDFEDKGWPSSCKYRLQSHEGCDDGVLWVRAGTRYKRLIRLFTSAWIMYICDIRLRFEIEGRVWGLGLDLLPSLPVV